MGDLNLPEDLAFEEVETRCIELLVDRYSPKQVVDWKIKELLEDMSPLLKISPVILKNTLDTIIDILHQEKNDELRLVESIVSNYIGEGYQFVNAFHKIYFWTLFRQEILDFKLLEHYPQVRSIRSSRYESEIES